MKRYFITLIFTIFSILCFGQGNNGNMQRPQRPFKPNPEMSKHFFKHKIDISQYEVIDSLPLERMYIFSPFDYEEEYIYKTETGLYLIDMPHKDKMIIKTNKDRTKAIILYNSFVFGRHKEFNIVETEKRLVLWYKDEDIYCGYIYDKRYKVCKYFEENDFFATF